MAKSGDCDFLFFAVTLFWSDLKNFTVIAFLLLNRQFQGSKNRLHVVQCLSKPARTHDRVILSFPWHVCKVLCLFVCLNVSTTMCPIFTKFFSTC